MEHTYNHMGHPNSSDTANFFAYLSPTTAAPPPNHHHHHPMDNINMNYFQSPDFFHHHHTGSGAVKSEGGAGSSNHHDGDEMEAMKAKIIAHPHYSNLLEAFMDCQKVGAPPEVAGKLSAIRQDYESSTHTSSSLLSASNDPDLDQFMEAYCDMLVKYKEELTRPVKEAMEFMHRIESQLNLLSNGNAHIINSDERCSGRDSSDGETEVGPENENEIDPRLEDKELKNHLLKKYSGYLSSLKQELSKKKKKGKLPKDARQKLLTWWELHYKWPYPSESEKVALAEATGLDQKQINNWFINQRKRHWKPSEDMQYMVMDGLHHHPHAHSAAAAAASFYMEGHYMGDHPPYRFGT